MRFVDRFAGFPPRELRGPVAQNHGRAFLEFLKLGDRERSQTRAPELGEPDTAGLRQALKALFSGKCAFCETRSQTIVYRFRPTHDAEPLAVSSSAHVCYGWLAMAWQNLLPICRECRPANPLFFPVKGRRLTVPTPSEFEQFLSADTGIWPADFSAEHPLLLDPCVVRDFSTHFRPDNNGRIEPLSPEGEATLENFRLNRSKLVERRKDAFARYYSAQFASVEPDEEFSGLWSIRASPEVRPPRPDYLSKQRKQSEPDPTPWEPLRQIEITNFKSLERLVVDMPEPPEDVARRAQALIVLGENATGKSTFLEAISLALSSGKAQRSLAPNPSQLRMNPGFLGVSGAEIANSASVRLRFGSDRVVSLKIDGDMITSDGKGDIPIFAYGAYRHFVTGVRRASADATVMTLFKTDRLLSNPERWLMGLREPAFRMVVQALREVFGAEKSFSVLDRDKTAKTCFLLHEIEGKEVGRTPLSSVSSGFRTILALVCDIMRWTMNRHHNPGFTTLASARAIVLIDEVEAHLHPRLKIYIMEGLRRALPAMTFIATTHDPLCLRGMQRDEVKVFRRVEGQSDGSPAEIDSLRVIPDVAGLTIEQILTSDLFGLYTTDDPHTEHKLARLADYLSRSGRGVLQTEANRQAMDELRKEISEALPIGLGEAARLVQEAVAEYLVLRRKLADTQRRALRDRTRSLILATLEAL